MKVNKKRDIWILTFVGILAGFFAIRVLESQHHQLGITEFLSPHSLGEYFQERSVAGLEQYVKEMKSLEKTRDDLLHEIDELDEIIRDQEKMAASRLEKGERIRLELQESRLIAGMVDLKGPGVEIVLDDRKRDTILDTDLGMIGYYIVHDSDLLEVINELRAAGAEAIAINGVRITGSSRISCGGPTINVGREQRFTPPFVIQAIGDPETLAAYFHRDDSIHNTLIFWGLRFEIKQKDQIEIPRFIGETDFKYAEPVKGG